jgi:hypothetical protein
MYDPVTARFLQEDTYSGSIDDPLSLNLYTYCHNEPLMYTDPDGHRYVPMGYSNKGVELGWMDEMIYVDVKGTDVEGTLKENGSVIVNVAPLATALGGKVSWNSRMRFAAIDINDKQVYYNANGYDIIGGHIQTDLKTSVDYFTNGGYNVTTKKYDSGSTSVSVSKKNPISGFFTKAVDVIGGHEYAFPKAVNMKANNFGTIMSDFYNDISDIVQSSEIAKQQIEAQLYCNSINIMLVAQQFSYDFAYASRAAASMDRVAEVFGASPRTTKGSGGTRFTGMNIYDDNVPVIEKQSMAIYDKIRKTGGYDDIPEILKNTGNKNVALLQKFKDHVFYNKHITPSSNGKPAYFDADIDIAYGWMYAQEGKAFTREQRKWFLQMMRHELSEARYMKKGYPYRDLQNPLNSAHDLAYPQTDFSMPGFDRTLFYWWAKP